MRVDRNQLHVGQRTNAVGFVANLVRSRDWQVAGRTHIGVLMSSVLAARLRLTLEGMGRPEFGEPVDGAAADASNGAISFGMLNAA